MSTQTDSRTASAYEYTGRDSGTLTGRDPGTDGGRDPGTVTGRDSGTDGGPAARAP
ncbi:hypothetical protein GCM10017752_09030 [Streptomyces roseoviridis]